MPTVKSEKRYLDLQEKIKTILARSMKMQAVKPEEALAMLFLLGQADNFDELKTFVGIFTPSFPALRDIGEEEKQTLKENIEAKIEAVVGKIVSTDPVLATRIAKAAQRPGATWEELVEEFPELEQ